MENDQGCALLLNFVPILARFDNFYHSITMEALTPTRCQNSSSTTQAALTNLVEHVGFSQNPRILRL